MIAPGYFQVLHQAKAIALYGIMNTRLLQIFQQFGKMRFNESRMVDCRIAEWPRRSLRNAVFVVQEKVYELVKPLLRAPDPFHY